MHGQQAFYLPVKEAGQTRFGRRGNWQKGRGNARRPGRPRGTLQWCEDLNSAVASPNRRHAG